MACGATFTSIERADYVTSLAFEDRVSHILPFSRDVLFISVYEACKHRSKAITEAAELTDTIIRKIMTEPVEDGKVTRATLLRIALQTLQSFDDAAATYYSAYHKA